MEVLGTGAALLAVGVLVLVVGSVVKRGAGALSLAFFTETPVTFGQTGGGIKHAIIGSAILIGLATIAAVPFGVLVAIYLTEFAKPRVAAHHPLVLDVLNGLPSIVIGVFVFGLLVVGHQQSGYAGRVRARDHHAAAGRALDAGGLLLVPSTLREAGLALGAPRWRTVLGVILPSALGGILTGSGPGHRPRRRRDGAAALHDLDLRRRSSRPTRRRRSRTSPSRSSSSRSQPDPSDHAEGVGGVARPDGLRPDRQPDRARPLARSRRKLAR